MPKLFASLTMPFPTLARTLLRDRFLKVGTLLFAATMVTNLFNFLFQVTMGRMLSPSSYGTLNALLSILMITAIPFATIMMVLARQTSIYRVEGDLVGVSRLFRGSYQRLYGIGIPCFFLFLLASPLVKGFLQMNSSVPVVLLGLVILLSMSFPINMAFLQGSQSFGPLAIASGSLGPLKYGFCVLLVVFGFGVNGVLAGHVLCYVALFLISLWPIHRALRDVSMSPRPFPDVFAKASPELTANLGFAVMTQFDLVLAKHLFSPELAGTYAIAAVFGRAVMYLPVSLVLALFPMVTESHALSQDPRPFLWKALVYTLLLSGTGALLCWLFPHYILGFLFGSKYLTAAPLFGLYAVVMLPLALLLVVMNFYIAQGKNWIWRLLALGAVLEIVLISLRHSHLRQILGAVFISGMLALLLCLYPVLRGMSSINSSRQSQDQRGV